MKIRYVAPDNVGAVWPMFKTYAERVIPLTNKRRCATKFLLDLMKNFEMLWVVLDESDKIVGFCSCAITPYDETKMFQVRMLSGDRFDEWIDDMHDLLERCARDNGCEGMELIGRRGWVRKLDRFGWKEAFVTVEKRFNG